MKARGPLFPSLGAETALADVQMRQTLALGLVPLGLVLLLFAAAAPDAPPWSVWVAGGLALGGLAVLAGMWRRAGRRYLRGYSTTHFLIRYLFVILCPLLLWIVFGRTILELGGLFPPLLLALLLLLYPAGRILQERVGPDPTAVPRFAMAYLVCQQIQMVLLVVALVGLLTGVVLDANRDYPTDPTPLLLFLWLLALLALLAGIVLTVAQWHRLFGQRQPPQSLDDPPPPSPPARIPRRESFAARPAGLCPAAPGGLRASVGQGQATRPRLRGTGPQHRR